MIKRLIIFLVLVLGLVTQGQGNFSTTAPYAVPNPFPALTRSQILTYGVLRWFEAENIQQTAGAVTSWTDSSTNAGNFVQATGANQPGYVSSAVNGYPAISINGTTKRLTGNVVFATNTVAIWAVLKNTAAAATYKNIFRETGSANNKFAFWLYNGYPNCFSTGANLSPAGQSVEASAPANTWVQLFGRINSAGLQHAAGSGNTSHNVIKSAFGGFASSACEIGASTYSLTDMDIAEILIIQPAPSDSVCRQIDSYMSKKFATANKNIFKPTVVYIGDSLTSASGIFANSYPTSIDTVTASQGYKTRMINKGVGGNTMSAVNARSQTDVDSYWTPGIAGLKQTVVVMAHVNTLGANTGQLPGLITLEKQWATDRRAIGWTVFYIDCTTRSATGISGPQTQAGFEIDRQGLITDMDSTPTAYGDVRVALPGILFTDGQYTNTTYFADGLHLTTSPGYTLLGSCVTSNLLSNGRLTP